MSQQFQHDVMVIGSGAAGLSLALTLPSHLRIAVLSKGDLANGSTFWAQGGVAAVLDDTDTVQSHVEDTLNAGGGLCNEEAVRFTVEHSREAIQWLIDQGVPFTRDEHAGSDDGGFEFHLTREGGHSHRRIIHAADATGAATHEELNRAGGKAEGFVLGLEATKAIKSQIAESLYVVYDDAATQRASELKATARHA